MIKTQHQRRRDLQACDGQRTLANHGQPRSSRSEPPAFPADVFAVRCDWPGKEMDHVAVMNAQAKVPGTAVVAVIGADLSLPLPLRVLLQPDGFTRTGPECPRRWLRVLREARALGAVQLGLSRREPLVRDDLELSSRRRTGWGSTSISSPPASGSTKPALRRSSRGPRSHFNCRFRTVRSR